MSFANRLIHTVTIFNPQATPDEDTTRYGDEGRGQDAGTASPALVQASLAGGQAREQLGGRDTATASYMVFLPANADVSALSVLEWDGKRLSVFGQPAYVYDSTSLHHIEVTAEEVQGG